MTRVPAACVVLILGCLASSAHAWGPVLRAAEGTVPAPPPEQAPPVAAPTTVSVPVPAAVPVPVPTPTTPAPATAAEPPKPEPSFSDQLRSMFSDNTMAQVGRAVLGLLIF